MSDSEYSMLDQNGKYLEATRLAAHAMINGAVKVDCAIFDATRSTLDAYFRQLTALGKVNELAGLAQLHCAYLSQIPAQALHFQREIAQAVAAAQHEMGRATRGTFSPDGMPASGFASAAAAAYLSRGQATSLLASTLSACRSAWNELMKGASANTAHRASKDLNPAPDCGVVKRQDSEIIDATDVDFFQRGTRL